VEVEEELSAPETVEILFAEHDWYPYDWGETKNNFINALEYDDPDITEEEIETILLEAKKEFDSRVKNLIKEESDQLKDRKGIINWLSDIIGEFLYEGMVGYCLTLDQIVDLIIKNGKKI
jgi:hypothetical protein